MKQPLYLINSSDLWINHSIQGRIIVTKMNELLQSRKNDQNYYSWCSGLIDQFDKLTHELNLCQQHGLNLLNLGPQRYNDDIYRIIKYTIVEAWFKIDLNDDQSIYNTLGWDEKWPYYGLVPRTCVELEDLVHPLQGLDILWSDVLFTPHKQLFVNYCIQIIMDIVHYVKTSESKINNCKRYYLSYNKQLANMGWNEDYLCELCKELYTMMDGWCMTTNVVGGLDVFFQIHQIFTIYDLLQPTKYLNWEQAHLYYLKKYPWLQLQFLDPLQYFTPFNTDVWVFVLFANVPNRDKYQQLLKIRAALKRVYELINSYPEDETNIIRSDLKFFGYRCEKLADSPAIANINDQPSVFVEKQPQADVLQQHNAYINIYNKRVENLEQRWKQDPVFRELCSIYIQAFEHPFILLEQIYHEARNQRAQGAQCEKYPDIDIYMISGRKRLTLVNNIFD